MRENLTCCNCLQVISELTLQGCGLDDAAMIQIASGLQASKHLKHLDLRNNHFEAQGMHSLASTLQAIGSCQTLMLEDAELDDEQALYPLK